MKIRGISRWLYPFSLLYGGVVRLRNLMFNSCILEQKRYPIPVICVGNLAVGGTGKTPMVEFLIRMLEDSYKIAVVSRGYKRKSKGMVVATPDSTTAEIGDEPKQILQNYPNTSIVVDANRRRAIDYLLSLPEEERPQIVILDDGLQHRYVQPSFTILLTDWNRPYAKDKLLPAGTLREPIKSYQRADCIVVTRCPKKFKPIDLRIIERNLELYPHQSLLFAETQTSPIKPVFIGAPRLVNDKTEVIAIAGIAHPEYFYKKLEGAYNLLDKIEFPDHYSFKKKDLRRIEKIALDYPNAIFIMTQKDAVRIEEQEELLSVDLRNRMFYIPIQTVFSEDKEELLRKKIEYSVCKTRNDKILEKISI